jgi:peptidyl-prolyl cis-trans isomerase B (cyclophilin B)
VSSGLYDGSTWHRVVSDFVIQGGDPRGSGWGDAGFSLRDEINPLRFKRGAVGMSNAGKDTGGCQLFITPVPAPHLDGRYTVFGRVTRGLDVVDRIEPGDRILKARVVAVTVAGALDKSE